MLIQSIYSSILSSSYNIHVGYFPFDAAFSLYISEANLTLFTGLNGCDSYNDWLLVSFIMYGVFLKIGIPKCRLNKAVKMTSTSTCYDMNHAAYTLMHQ